MFHMKHGTPRCPIPVERKPTKPYPSLHPRTGHHINSRVPFAAPRARSIHVGQGEEPAAHEAVYRSIADPGLTLEAQTMKPDPGGREWTQPSDAARRVRDKSPHTAQHGRRGCGRNEARPVAATRLQTTPIQLISPRPGAAQPARRDPARRGPTRLTPAGPTRCDSVSRPGVTRLGPARHGPARLGPPRLGSARLGPARLGTARRNSTRPRHDPARHDATRHDPARPGTARRDPARLGTTRHDPARRDPARHDAMPSLGSARL